MLSVQANDRSEDSHALGFLICIDLSTIGTTYILHLILSMQQALVAGHEQQSASVDHSDIRGSEQTA